MVFFSRVRYGERLDTDNDEADQSESQMLSRDPSGRLFRDFYRVLVDSEIRSDWSSLLKVLRREFMDFQREILQHQVHFSNVIIKRGDGSTALSGENCHASEGNILEAINLAMNSLDKHYIDRDLMRTGQSIIIVTAGTGIFEVDKKLCRLTSQRMIDNGMLM
jgi:hypothetical protein